MTEIRAQLMVVLGAGGVGKTTSAAALSLALAERGQKVVVITVDPAKRLAQALGLDTLSDEPKIVAEFAESGGSLAALWLDSRVALDDLVRRHGSSLGNTEKILRHRLFKIIQTQLGGIEEYLGIEKILSLGQSGQFDVCVLDTPPSRHALDFFESPKHLVRFFDESVLRIFLAGDESEQGGFFRRIFQSGKNQAIDIFRHFLGATFLGELAELLQNLQPVQKVLVKTAGDIERWIRQPSTQMIVVSLLEAYPLDEARLLGHELANRTLPRPALMILNKCFPATAPDETALAKALGEAGAKSLADRFREQRKLREALNSPTEMQNGRPSVIAEVPRYSVKRLRREELLQMGRGILSTWLPRDV